MYNVEKPLARLFFMLSMGTVVLCGCNAATGAKVPQSSMDYAARTPDNPSEGALRLGADHTKSLRLCDWNDGQQQVHMDAPRKLVTVSLNGLTALRQNRSLDFLWQGQRLDIHVPSGWSVRSAVPATSAYHAAIVPTGLMPQSGVINKERVQSEVRFGPTLHANQPGMYSLLIRLPGQKGGHVIDQITVSRDSVPSVGPVHH